MKNLETMGVQEMNALEMSEIDGGFVIWVAIGMIILMGVNATPAY